MGNWFGSLDLAYKYALVFGSALLLTLIAGTIKVIIDKRKLNRFIKEQEDVEASKQAMEDHTLPIAMREKDEGDLFGIRAIEAGFFGGVAQSAPVSRAASPAGSRPGSPTGSSIYGNPGDPPSGPPLAYHPSPSHTANSSTTLIHQHHNPTLNSRGIPDYKVPSDGFHKGMHDNITVSASSSVLSLGQSYRAFPVPTIRLYSPSPVLNRSAQVDTGLSVFPSSVSTSPILNPPFRPSPVLKLRPSQAELSGRIKHTQVGMTRTLPPSSPPGVKGLPEGFPYGSPAVSPQRSTASSSSLSQSDTLSPVSSNGSQYPALEEWEAAALSAASKRGPERSGEEPSKLASANISHILPRYMREAINGRDASPILLSLSDQKRTPVPPLMSPAFQKSTIYSSYLFDYMRQERPQSHNLHGKLDLQNDLKDEREVDQGSSRTASMDPERKIDPNRLTVDVGSGHTSFSFDYANSDGLHPEDVYFSVQPLQHQDSFLSNKTYVSGTYRPAGRPASSIYD